jgi:hypothetical protein
MTPRQAAARLEARRRIAGGATDRFAGYALPGLAFESGHIVAFRRATASSIGPPFTSIWIRSPDGEWTAHANVDRARSCARYFSSTVPLDVRNDDIELKWNGARELAITARHARLHLALRLGHTPATALLGAAVRSVPARLWWHWDRPLEWTATAAAALGIGLAALSGRAPSGHAYRVRPHGLWRVQAAAAVLGGRDAGAAVPLDVVVPPGYRAQYAIVVAAELELRLDAVAAAISNAPTRADSARTTDDVPSRDEILRRVMTRQ